MTTLVCDCFFACIDEDSKGTFIVQSADDREKLKRFGIYKKKLIMKPPHGTLDYVCRDVVVYIRPVHYNFMSNGKRITGARPMADKIKLKNVPVL
jgi:hypothetical protein